MAWHDCNKFSVSDLEVFLKPGVEIKTGYGFSRDCLRETIKRVTKTQIITSSGKYRKNGLTKIDKDSIPKRIISFWKED